MTSHNKIFIRKASGEYELFDESKLKHSLERAGADKRISESIAFEVKKVLFEGISTRKIYSIAFRILRRHDQKKALLYKLKQSLFELGPTGYPFEFLIGEIFKRRGFEVDVGKIIDGHCITHEMDVIATNKAEIPAFSNLTFSAGVVTNTRFSSESIEYSKCNGIMLLGWDYPQNNGLKEIMENENIYPITILGNLTKNQKEQLMDQGVVTCKQLVLNMKILTDFTISKRKLMKLEQELDDIMNL